MDAQVRASDADRERLVLGLQEQVGSGRLTLEEFSERAAAAYRARTFGELDVLTRDLPSAAPGAQRRLPRPRLLLVALLLLGLLIGGSLLALSGPVAGNATSGMMAHPGSMMPMRGR